MKEDGKEEDFSILLEIIGLFMFQLNRFGDLRAVAKLMRAGSKVVVFLRFWQQF